MMLGPVSAWLVWGVLALAGCGLWAVLWQADQLARYLWERFRGRDRDGSTDDTGGDGEWRDGLVRAETERLLELPPERSAGELGFTGEQPAVVPDPPEGWASWTLASRERRAPWWEAEHRAAYESLNLDYPSGLLARVREAGR